jgi:hypothetical protein
MKSTFKKDYPELHKALGLGHKNPQLKRKREYYKRVWQITEDQNISELFGDKKRGFNDYHVDHIVPISYGFKNGIDPLVIGDKSNLNPLFCKDNMKKGQKLI